MPEMLWAALLAGVFDRKTYIGCFRELIKVCAEWFRAPEADAESEGQSPTDSNANDGPDEEGNVNYTYIVDHTTLAEVSDEQFAAFIAMPLRHPLGYAALRPLLLLDSLPAKERWREALGTEPTAADWETLANAVGGVLDHQSEQSTDIRWFKLMVPSISGRVHYPREMADRIDELCSFPDKGDMRKVRPFIRSGEMMMRRNPPSPWISNFWAELLEKTRCIDPSKDDEYSVVPSMLDPNSFYPIRPAVIERFTENMRAVRVDAKLDTSFGLVLYALSIVEEVGFHAIQRSITGRFALRALVEANIALRYLIIKDDEALWRSYRVYGAGQAKLAFLKAQELEGDLPQFVDPESLQAIANEDVWQEYLDIDIGHWTNSNLRKLATECGAKDLYDQYYGWSSAFLHSHWGAVRDTNFSNCHNPLHRLHRIPRFLHRMVNAVDGDLITLANDMLSRLHGIYPGPEPFPTLRLRPEEPDSLDKDSTNEP